MNVPLVSTDVTSMYMGVIKAYSGLGGLPPSTLTLDRFPNARTLEICVTISGLTQGLGRLTSDYPMTEAPVWPALFARPTAHGFAGIDLV